MTQLENERDIYFPKMGRIEYRRYEKLREKIRSGYSAWTQDGKMLLDTSSNSKIADLIYLDVEFTLKRNSHDV